MYEDFYHLNSKPFRLSPDPGFFFASRGHKRALAYLRYGLSQDEGFVVITGAPGTGKTTLAQILLREMDQSDLIVAHLTTTQLEAEEMLRMVVASLGLQYEGLNKAALLKELEHFLLGRAREGMRVLLVIDEAQNLPPSALEELRMLSNLQVGDKALVQTFLLGQAQFRQKLDHSDLEQLRQRVIANYHLSELAEDECQDYIECRLQHVGWEGDPSFTPAAYKGIYNYTKGIPRRINMLCDRLMLFACLEERHDINQKVLKQVTEELQQEISGKPIVAEEMVEETESLNKALDEKTSNAGAVNTKPLEDVVDEVLDSGSASLSSEYVDVDKESESDQLDKVVPDESYEELVAQSHTSEDEFEGVKQGTVTHHNSAQTSKDRFHVISGGRGDVRSTRGNDEMANARPANSPTTEVKAPVPDSPGDSEEVVLRKILRLVLAYHRSPRSFPGLDDPSQPLPRGITNILSLAVSDDEVLRNLRQIAVMGISPAMLRAAVRFFVRRVMFLPGGDDFRVLGLSPGASMGKIEQHYGLLMRLMRQEKKSADESGVTRIGEAYERLCEGEITHVPEEEPSNEIDDLEDFEELDLDLAPNIPGYGTEKAHPEPELADVSDVITHDQKNGPTSRNFMLVAGAIVVIFVLYLTQISTTVKPGKGREVVNPENLEQITEPNQAQVDTQQNVVPQGTTASTEAATNDAVGNDTTPSAGESAQDTEARRQEILSELRAKEAADEIEIARQEAIAQERARLQAELKKAAEAQAAAEAKARQEAEARAKAEAAARAAAKAKADAEAKARVALVAKQAAAKIQQKTTAASAGNVLTKAGAIRVDSLNAHVARLEKAYADGNLNELRKLFSTTARTNKEVGLDEIKTAYSTEINITDSRRINISNMEWEVEKDFARGRGHFEKTSFVKDSLTKTVTTGTVTLQVEEFSGRLKIKRLYFSDEVTSTQSESASKKPTEAELNSLLDKFVKAYQQGDIDEFMTVFSRNAKTNDRSNLVGIRTDYVDLFDSTENRKLEMSGMAWKWASGVSKATGRFVVEVKPIGQQTPDVYKGRLFFDVVRTAQGLKISFFAFSVEG